MRHCRYRYVLHLTLPNQAAEVCAIVGLLLVRLHLWDFADVAPFDATKLLLLRGCSQGLKLPQSTPGISLNPCASHEGPRSAGAVATALILVVVLDVRRCQSVDVAHAAVVAVNVAMNTVCYLCSPNMPQMSVRKWRCHCCS